MKMRVYLNALKIKEILARKNKSQNWLAYRLGISTGYISQLLESQRSPSPALRERIIQQLKEHEFDDLFFIAQKGPQSGLPT